MWRILKRNVNENEGKIKMESMKVEVERICEKIGIEKNNWSDDGRNMINVNEGRKK
jgi:hypothetical protein